MIEEGFSLWCPTPAFAEGSNLARYSRWLAERGLTFENYDALWHWSVEETDAFWTSIWDYFEVQSETPYRSVRSGGPMPGTIWFDGARINLAEHLLRHEVDAAPGEVAIHHLSEIRPLAAVGWAELGDRVRRVATAMRAMGIGPGDRVASCLPNVVEAAIALIATAAIGAVWTSVAPEYGARAAADRLSQVKPRLLFVADGYRYAGVDHDCRGTNADLIAELGSLDHVVLLPYLDSAAGDQPDPAFTPWAALEAEQAPARQDFRYERVGSDHPLWILFTSGTTGLPKPIVHGQLGITLELFRAQALSADVGPGSTLFNHASTAWVVWNMQVGALVTGTAIVLYDGHPLADGPDTMWRIAAHTGVTDIGFSPALVRRMIQSGRPPADRGRLDRLRHVILVGSPATPEVFEWLFCNVGADLWVTSQAGSTELCTGFAGGVPTLPVKAGEIQARLLGMAVESWSDDGRSVTDEEGELVLTAPCPMMPLRLWNDQDGERYLQSYFADFPGIWRQGDRCMLTASGGLVIFGRSDATMNRGGIRIGTAEIYRTLTNMDEIEDSVAFETVGEGQSRMMLFVVLADGVRLDEGLQRRIADRLRRENSPRHAPDDIIAAPGIPYTATGKRMEVPLRRLFNGEEPGKVADRSAMADPGVFDWYDALARKCRARRMETLALLSA